MLKEVLAVVGDGKVEIKDLFNSLPEPTQRHSERVAKMTAVLAGWADRGGLYPEEPLPAPEVVEQVVLYHDIGMVLVPERLLKKREQLTDAEQKVMHRHTGYGAKLLDKYRTGESCPQDEDGLWRLAAEIALTHHEQWDGLGYPHGQVATATLLLSRIVAIANTWDAITHGAHFRMALPQEYALLEILDNSGTQFDPLISKLFMKHYDELRTLTAEEVGA